MRLRRDDEALRRKTKKACEASNGAPYIVHNNLNKVFSECRRLPDDEDNPLTLGYERSEARLALKIIFSFQAEPG